MKKLREFVHNKCKTYLESLRLSEQISNTLRVPTSIFVEIIHVIVGELIDTSQSTNFFKMSKHRDFLVCPGTTISPTTKPKL